MDYTSISYSRTRQVAQYEPETMGVHATLEPGDDLQECAAKLKADVNAALTGKIEAPAKPEKKKKSSKKEAEVEEEAAVEEEEEEEKPKKKKKESSKKTTKKKTSTKKKKPVAYDREIQDHKTAFGELLLEIEPKWQKDPELKKKAKELSSSMEGTPMFDGNTGEILDAFRDEVAEGLSADDDDL